MGALSMIHTGTSHSLCNSLVTPTDILVQRKLGPSCGALKYPAVQGHIATATPVVIVLAGHGRQESAGSERERYVPAGQAERGNIQMLIETPVSRSHDL